MQTDAEIKKEADNLMSIKGRTKGSEFLTLKSFIEQKYGIEKVKLLEKEMQRLGYPIDFGRITPTKWYPEALNVLAMIAAKRIFGWKDLFDFGYHSPQFSMSVRLFIKFSSYERVMKECAKTWNRFVDVGKLECVEFKEKEKLNRVQLSGYKFHPDVCRYLTGYFLKISEYAQKTNKMTIKETKCRFRGDSCHEFTTHWE